MTSASLAAEIFKIWHVNVSDDGTKGFYSFRGFKIRELIRRDCRPASGTRLLAGSSHVWGTILITEIVHRRIFLPSKYYPTSAV